jgi:hypothetical protein
VNSSTIPLSTAFANAMSAAVIHTPAAQVSYMVKEQLKADPFSGCALRPESWVVFGKVFRGESPAGKQNPPFAGDSAFGNAISAYGHGIIVAIPPSATGRQSAVTQPHV